jgi:hypothetical protein
VDLVDMSQDRDQWRVCENGNEPSGSIRNLEFLVQLND